MHTAIGKQQAARWEQWEWCAVCAVCAVCAAAAVCAVCAVAAVGAVKAVGGVFCLPGVARQLGEVHPVLDPLLEILVEVHDRAVAEIEQQQDERLHSK